MEVKKSPKADLQNKKGMFFQIGLIVALGLSILLFNYSKKVKEVEVLDMGIAMVEEELVEITTQDNRPPEPMRQTISVMSDIINIVKDETKIKTDIDFTDFTEDAVIVTKRADVVEGGGGGSGDVPFVIVEQMPKFKGGDLETFRKWVLSQINYPQIAQDNGVEGKVILSFVIEKDGKLTSIELLSNADRSLVAEAERVLKSSPLWTPGKQRNMTVRVKYTLPVEFKISSH